jgi:hypothetical protein
MLPATPSRLTSRKVSTPGPAGAALSVGGCLKRAGGGRRRAEARRLGRVRVNFFFFFPFFFLRERCQEFRGSARPSAPASVFV